MRVVKVLWLVSVLWFGWTACRVRPTVAWTGMHTRGIWLEDRIFGKYVTLTAHQQQGKHGYTAAGVYLHNEIIDHGYYLGVFHEDGMVMTQWPKQPGTVKQIDWFKLKGWK